MSANMFIHALADVQTVSIGEGTRIWQFAVVAKGAKVGKNCNFNCHTFVEGEVVIGNNVTIKSGVYLWNGVYVEDDVFIGPNVTFINDKNPRSGLHEKERLSTRICKGASLGAGSVILGGVTIGAYALVGAGSLVTRNVPDFALVKGSPAVISGWVDKRGIRLKCTEDGHLKDAEGRQFVINDNKLSQL